MSSMSMYLRKEDCAADELRAHWNQFCDADYFDELDGFEDRMEQAGLIELVPVADEHLDDAFAYERGIEPGGMVWQLTAAGRAAFTRDTGRDDLHRELDHTVGASGPTS